MTFWIWVVVVLVLSLVTYELFSWIRRKRRPAQDEAAADAQLAVEAQAELTRANMKIAVLESRLEAAEIKHEDDLAALEEQHKQQIVKTEAAYQRQMVVLSERLAENGKGDWRVAAKREKAKKQAADDRYAVRMAAEVAAWKVETFGDDPTVDTAVSEGEAISTKDNDVSIDRPDPAVNTPEETADPNAMAAGQIDGPQANGVAATVAAISGLGLAEIEASVEDEYGRMDDAPEEIWAVAEAQTAGEGELIEPAYEEPSINLVETAFEEETWRPDREEELLDQIVVYNDEVEADPETAVEEMAAPDEDNGMDGEVLNETAEPEDPVTYFGNQWPDHDDPAMQRVMARRLGSEMDADYLDDDEFLKEMGIEQLAPEQFPNSGEAAEDIMGAENWVTDPIEELSVHLTGETPGDPEELPSADGAVEGPGPELEVTDQAWEEMVYAGEETEAYELDDAADMADVEQAVALEAEAVMDEERPTLPAEQSSGADDAAIAATVAEILSRAPNGKDLPEDDPGQNSFEQQRAFEAGERYDAPAAEDRLEDGVPAGVAVEEAVAAGDAAPTNGGGKRPVLQPFIWQRDPIVWEAEYYDNTRLADQPAVVRKDKDIDFEWRGMAPARGIEPRSFSVRWTGMLPLGRGQYRFSASAPDGLRLWLNDRLVISAWYDQSEQTYQRDFFWNGGSIDVRVEHYENGGDAKAFLTWERVA